MVLAISRSLLFANVFFAFLIANSASAQSPLENLFQAGKREFKLASYEASLKTFQKLDEMSQQPGFEAARIKLEPLIAFYRGANYAALGQKEPAQKQFEIYLASFSAARLDPAMFPRSVIQVFEKAKEEAAEGRGGMDKPPAHRAEESIIAEDYAHFRPDTSGRSVPMDEKWAEGAIRFLMSSAERDEWRRLDAAGGRAEFIAKFWQRRDPTPLTLENEFREEIERRVAFADTRFTAEEKRGSETDRGLVFVLLGPPSYIAQKPFMSGDDSIQAARNAPTQELVGYDQRGRKVMQSIPRGALTAETLQGMREIWYYRRDRLPEVIRFPEVDFEFITKKGLGTAVLQRENDILLTLDLAAKATLPSRD